MKMYEALIDHLRECAKYDNTENTFKEAAEAIEELCKMVSIDNARAYLDRDDLVNTLTKHKKSFDLNDRYGDYGMGFSEAIKVVAMMYPVYMSEPPKGET